MSYRDNFTLIITVEEFMQDFFFFFHVVDSSDSFEFAVPMCIICVAVCYMLSLKI